MAFGQRFCTCASNPGRTVGTHVRDQGRSLLAEQVEEAVQGTRVGPVRGMDEPTSIVVDHHEQVAIVTSVGDLVDANAPHALEEFLAVEVLDDARNDLSDRASRAAQQSSRRR